MTLRELDELQVRKRVVLMWVPTHIEIPGNEATDELAKDALRSQDGQMVPNGARVEDFMAYVRRHTSAKTLR